MASRRDSPAHLRKDRGFVARGSTSPTAAESAWLPLGVLRASRRSGDSSGGEIAQMAWELVMVGRCGPGFVAVCGRRGHDVGDPTTAITFAAWVKRCAPPRLFFKTPPSTLTSQIHAHPPAHLHTQPALMERATAGFFGYVKLPGGFRPRGPSASPWRTGDGLPLVDLHRRWRFDCAAPARHQQRRVDARASPDEDHRRRSGLVRGGA